MAVTDCCNYGNPENPEEYWEFCEGIRGLDDACRKICQKNGEPIIPVAGNVSFYNYSIKEGKKNSIDPSMVISAIGKVRDCDDIITPWVKEENNILLLVGARRNELGGSEYYKQLGFVGKNVPTVDFELLRREINVIIDCIEVGAIKACHDISEGGIACCAAEMCMLHKNKPGSGAKIIIDKETNPDRIREDSWLFSETGGFVLEVSKEKYDLAELLLKKYGVPFFKIGAVTGNGVIEVLKEGEKLVDLQIDDLKSKWQNALSEVLE